MRQSRRGMRSFFIFSLLILIGLYLYSAMLAKTTSENYTRAQLLQDIDAGKIEKGENPDETIIREAEEELGYEVKDVVKLGYMIPTCGYSSEKIYLYFGKAARKVKQHFDEDEFINVYKYSFDELKKMVIDGTLDDGKTIALMYKIELMGLDK